MIRVTNFFLLLSEQTFNHKFNYPWIFLNEEPFTEEFINATTSVASSKTHYGLVDESMWGYPDWIDQTHASNMRIQMKDLPYGTSESYRHMCRFQRLVFLRACYLTTAILLIYFLVHKVVSFGDIHLF